MKLILLSFLTVVLGATSPFAHNAIARSPQLLTQTEQQNARSAYRPVNLNDWTPADLMGKRPGAIAMQILGRTEASEGGKARETMEIHYPSYERAIAVLTKTGLDDDSVSGLRYRVEFVKQPNGRWRIAWIGLQTKCQLGRGHQNWANRLCT